MEGSVGVGIRGWEGWKEREEREERNRWKMNKEKQG